MDACTLQASRAGQELYTDASLGAQCDGWPRDDRPVRLPFQAKPLDHRSQDQNGFHHGKPVPDADPRSPPKWHVGEPRKPVSQIVAPAPRSECTRLVIEPGIAMQNPGPHQHGGPRLHAIPADYTVVQRLSSKEPSWRVE